MFAYMGKLVAEGGRYWADLVDNKLPTVGLLTSAAWRAFGPWWWGYILLQMAMSLGACLALGQAARIAAGEYARGPTMLFALVYLNLNQAVFGGFQLETIHAFFASLAAIGVASILADGRCDGSAEEADAEASRPASGAFLSALMIGLCSGIAAMAKPTGLALAGAFGLTLLIRPQALRRIVAAYAGLAVGLLIVAGGALAYFVVSDTLQYWPANLAQTSEYARHSATDIRDINKPIWAAVIIGLPLLTRGFVFRRQAIASAGEQSIGCFALFAILWLALEAIGVGLQRRMYGYHFLVLAPPAAVLFGIIRRQASARQMVFALAPALAITITGTILLLNHAWKLPPQLESSAYIAAHARADDAVWRDHGARTLIETDLRPGSRYPLTFLFVNSDEAAERYWREMHRDFETRRPRWMVLPNDLSAYLQDMTEMVAELERLPGRRAAFLNAWGALEAYIREHYVPVARLGHETVYERRPDADSAVAGTSPADEP